MARPLSLEEIRKVYSQKILRMDNGHRVRTAQILGIGRNGLADEHDGVRDRGGFSGRIYRFAGLPLWLWQDRNSPASGTRTKVPTAKWV